LVRRAPEAPIIDLEYQRCEDCREIYRKESSFEARIRADCRREYRYNNRKTIPTNYDPQNLLTWLSWLSFGAFVVLFSWLNTALGRLKDQNNDLTSISLWVGLMVVVLFGLAIYVLHRGFLPKWIKYLVPSSEAPDPSMAWEPVVTDEYYEEEEGEEEED